MRISIKKYNTIIVSMIAIKYFYKIWPSAVKIEKYYYL